MPRKHPKKLLKEGYVEMAAEAKEITRSFRKLDQEADADIQMGRVSKTRSLKELFRRLDRPKSK